jgi:hypothetical protein
MPFGKQPAFIIGFCDRGPAVSPMKNVSQKTIAGKILIDKCNLMSYIILND